MPEPYSWTQVATPIIQVVTPIITLCAILVALFKERIIAWWYAPKLTITARPHPPDIDQIPFGPIDGYCLRLWIENEGKSRAEKVEVFVREIIREIDGASIPMTSFIPMHLRWAFGSATPTHAEVFADGISPGMGVYCNLAQILDPSKREGIDDHSDANPGETVMRLLTELHPTNRSNIFPRGTYKLTLWVAGSNCPRQVYTLQIILVGKWFKEREKMLREGVIMKIIEGPSKPQTRKAKAGR